MTAVIYARYSSDNQREESIEGQIRECTAYAEKNGITIVKHYIDRAISAKTDNRPEFQQMIKDSDKKLFDIVLVWKLDRFARNRYDSARYKTQLKKNGVKLMSATEIISEGPEGIILESVLEGYAEYYTEIESVETSDGVVLVVSVEKSSSHVATTGGIYYRRLGNVTKPDYPANDVYSPADNPDFSAKIVEGATESDIDLLEVYRLKEKLRIRDAGSALPDLADTTFLDNLNLIRMDKDEVRVTVAGLLFVGKAASIARLLPQAEVIYLHYSDEAQTEYDNRMDMQEPVISILDKLTERIRTYNRLTNVQVGLFRLEVYDFSEAVFQEALLNALAHRSYEDMAPVYVKHYPTKIVIENPGGFPGDINESNIITHQSIPRNKLIAMTLQHLKYVQRSGQGVDIMFQSMLTEGKPYPEYASTPNSVRLTLRSTMENQSFVRFIAETQDKRSKMFTLSELMILHYLREHQKITLKQAAKTIQETDDNAHKVLNALRDEGLLELNGKTYMLSLKVYETVKTDVAYVQDKTVSQIQAKDRILEYLKHKPSITNQKAQELCGFNKNQTYYILHQMCKDGILQPDGVGRGTKYKSVK